MKRLLLMIIAVLAVTLTTNAQNGTLDPTNPPEPQVKYKLTVKAQPAEAATTNGSGEYAEGTSVTVRASAKSNYVFKYWTRNGVQQSQTSTSFKVTMPAEDLEYVAVFEYHKPEFNPSNPAEPQAITPEYPLYLVADPIGGGSFNRTSGAKVKEGTTVSVKATPATGYQFVGWYSAEGELLSSSASVSLTMPSKATTLTAHFTYNPNSPAEPSGNQEGVDNAPDAVTLAAKNYIRYYGDENPTLEYDVVGGTITSGTPTLSCAATKTSPVGIYDIIITKGSVSNSSVSVVKGTLSVIRAPLTINAGNYTRKQGEENPEFTLEYEGFKNGETESVLTSKPTVTTLATPTSKAGTYEVNISGAEAQNYDILYVDGTLTVTAVEAVVVTAKSYTITYGEAPPTYEYTSEGAALMGTPEITCDATATSPVGAYDIVIKKGSVTNYNDSYVKGTLTITKAPLKVKAGTYTRKQGEENPEFTLEYEGFKNGETEAVLSKKPVATTTATKESAVGDYTVTVSGGEAQNYELSYVNGTLKVIEVAPVIVTAKSYSRVYGEANPVFEFTSEGAALTGAPQITCAAKTTSPVGTYPITITKGSVTNTKDTYVNGTLTITKAPLTITAKSYTIKQGEALPKFEITYSGFKNGETKSVLKTQPKVTCSATSTSESGTYDIIVSGATADNYEITHVKGTLRIRSLVAALGDINNDGEVDVTDVVELIDMVLAGSNDPIGDINGDGEVDVTDVVELIDIVLGN
ncbi:MAG: hypothetical protein K6G32_10265 [Prevotella sp.]|nr:hypothetical protein [Prevotella sp.]